MNAADQLHKQRAAEYQAAQDQRDEANKARARQGMEQQANSPHPASEASVNRLVRSSRVMYGNKPDETTVRAWAANAGQRAVSSRIEAIEAMTGFDAKRQALSNGRKAGRPQGKLDEVPEGRYAADVGGHWRFFKVDRPTEGRWAGYVFMKEGTGGDFDDLVWHKMGRDRREAAAAAILAAGLQASMKEFGKRMEHCGHCGRSLTNDHTPGPDGLTSIQRGIGPVCAGKKRWL